MERTADFGAGQAFGGKHGTAVDPVIKHGYPYREVDAIGQKRAGAHEHAATIGNQEVSLPGDGYGITVRCDVADQGIPIDAPAIIVGLNSARKAGSGVGGIVFGGFLCAANKHQAQNQSNRLHTCKLT